MPRAKTIRRLVQVGFVALTLVGVYVVRGNAERWCPFGGVEAIYAYLHEGNLLCSLGISNFYILGGVLLATLLLRRAFCGYACPIGALSEWLQGGARRLGLKPKTVPYTLDRVLAKLKYVVLAVILYFTWSMAELEFRAADPCYALISRHGEDITFWAYVVSGAIVIASLFVLIPFCRWLCPFAAVLHPFSRFGLTRIRRDEDTCIDCGECSKVCPTGIPVAKLKEVTAARCLSCLNCTETCTRDVVGALHWGPPRWLGRAWPQGVLVAILFLCLGGAVAAVYAFPLPSFVHMTPGRGAAPAQVATAEFGVQGLTCRGKATLFAYYLERDDEYAVPGYVKIEAWPGPGAAPTRILYDPSRTNVETIRQAITEPYYDATAAFWRPSPFTIEGYDPLGLEQEETKGQRQEGAEGHP
jgi:hypothetical protein